MKPIKPLVTFIKKFKELRKEMKSSKSSNVVYKLADIETDKEENYVAIIQVIGKGITFKVKPEELLADDNTIDDFSQKDIRALTYLGYLNTNNPKYKVVATHHSKELNKMIFALNKKGDKKPVVVTADQISIDEKILTSLSPEDAHKVGYITATEQALLEKQEKERLKKERLEKK